MDSYKVSIEADSDNCVASEMLSISDTSSQDENGRTRRGTEPKNQMKLRSIKLSRLPSLRSCIRPMKSPSSQCPSLLSGYAASSEYSTPVMLSDASPDHIKAASCSHARKEGYKKSIRTLSRRASFKPVKNLSRMSSMKFWRPSMRASSGADQKRKLKKTRSIKLASSGRSRPSSREDTVKYDQSSTVLSSEADRSPKHSKAQFQESHHNSESSFSSDDQSRKNPKFMKAKSDSSASVLKRSSTLRPQRILTKTVSLKSKRPPRKCTEVSEISDPSVHRATCASTLKDSKFPQRIEHQTRGSESGGNLAVKVCPYTYCSLHGHRHATLPPLKRFVSMRRRLIKPQKSTKLESRSGSGPNAKRSSNRRKAIHSSVAARAYKVELKDEGTLDVEDKLIHVSGDLTEISLGETLYPQSSLETNDSPTANQHIQVAFWDLKETGQECQGIAVEPIKPIPEASNTEVKDGKIVATSINGGDDNPICDVDHHKISDSSSAKLKNSIERENLSVRLDRSVSSSFEGDPADAIACHVVKEGTVASLSLEMLKGDSESNIGVLEASAKARVNLDEKDEDSEPDSCFREEISASVDSAPNYISDKCHITQTHRQKFTGFWGLIYQHMVSGIATDVETPLPLDGKCKEEQDEGNHKLPQKENPVSYQIACGKDQDISMRYQDAGDRKFELQQSDAVKLVQEAFDKILSEIPDQSSDDQSISSDITSERDFLRKKQAKSGDQDISSSFDGTKEGVAHDPEETELQFININACEEGEAASQLGNNSNQKISNWSNLKKIIILKRFVKALEKVRNYNPRKPRLLEMEPDPETEKVHLRHQTVEERKNADEWMLDYALRQVISKLAPAQKRKVALIVEAFETVSPLPEIKSHLSSIPKASSHATPVQGCNGSHSPRDEQNTSRFLSKASYRPNAEQLVPGTCSELKEESLRCGFTNTELGTPVSKTAQPYLEEDETVACNLDNGVYNSSTKDNQPVINSSPLKYERLTSSDKHSPKLDDTQRILHEKLVNGKYLQEINDSEVHDHNAEFNYEKLETVNIVNAADLQSCQPENSNPEDRQETKAVKGVISSSFSKLLEETTTSCGGEADPRYEIHLDSSPLEGPECNESIDMVQEAKMEKQKYMRLWYIIYKHMVSASGEGGTQSLLQGADYKERDGDANTLLERQDADSCKNFSETNREIVVENQNERSQKIECNQIEAIKLIEKAIDEIHLPDIQDDSSDDQSIAGSTNPETEISKKNVEDGKAFISTYTDSAEDTSTESNNKKLEHHATLDPEARLDSTGIGVPEESETVGKLGNNSKPQTLKNWSNLKKLILLRRFIKAVEKVRKFSPREPRYLPLDADSEAEKVHLRHQSMQDKKNAEEWMLDYALQQVVTKLTPARKRKVELLVEAFETVNMP